MRFEFSPHQTSPRWGEAFCLPANPFYPFIRFHNPLANCSQSTGSRPNIDIHHPAARLVARLVGDDYVEAVGADPDAIEV